MRIAERIWKVPAYLPYVQPVLTDEAVTATENQLGFKLPSEYIDLLRVQNGGYIRLSLHEIPAPHEVIAGIGPRFPRLTFCEWSRFWKECQPDVSYPLHSLVPFDGDGHWYLCLDYRNDSTNPSVSYIDIESDHQIPDIAASFAEYLRQLRLKDEDEYVLEAVADIEAIKMQLSSKLGVEFEPLDPSDLIERMSLGNLQWLYLIPNRVRRGRVPTDNKLYDEVKDLLPGNALRYPEVPDGSYILAATDGVRSNVLDACADAQIDVRQLREYVDIIR